MRALGATLALGWLWCACACAPVHARSAPSPAPAPKPAGPIQHALVITLDGLVPDSYLHPEAHGLEVPVLRSLVAGGAASPGALSVFPSLTYPAHTSIASGVRPSRHGVVSNSAFDPLEKNMDAWRWYAEDVAAPRLWDVAYARGYSTALIDWPVTVGVKATYHVPEFWRARVDDDLKLIRALSTPGLLERVSAAYPTFAAGFRPQQVTDEAGTEIVLHLIETAQPVLTFLHVWQVDAAQHKHGLWSPEARAAIENADRQIGRILASLERAGIAEHTSLVIASDHGFAAVKRTVNPAVLLGRAGLFALDDKGKVESWQASVLPCHGVAYVYLARSGDAALEAATLEAFERALKTGKSGIARILKAPEIAASGGDPAAFLALEAELGTSFAGGKDEYETPPPYAATHGYAPEHPEMLASLLLFGPNVPHGTLEGARLIDIAPTVAGWLGLALSGAEGKPLQVVTSP
jgi:predicted AlkP superfamily pyrophosphatase or phosphodiesterase